MKLLSAIDHSPSPSPTDLTGLAARIERHGLADIEPSVLHAIAGRARRVGVHPEVAGLLTDGEAPTVVRVRAFGLIHRRLDLSTAAAPDPVLAVA